MPGLRNSRRLLAAFGRSDVPVAAGVNYRAPLGGRFRRRGAAGADGFYGVELPAVEGETARDEETPELWPPHG